jgi:hypothetical protein
VRALADRLEAFEHLDRVDPVLLGPVRRAEALLGRFQGGSSVVLRRGFAALAAPVF